MSGKALAERVFIGLINLDLDIRNCHEQGYDTATAVSENINRLSSHICKNNSKAIYAHNYSHHFKLVICASCNIQYIGNIFDQIQEISYFFQVF